MPQSHMLPHRPIIASIHQLRVLTRNLESRVPYLELGPNCPTLSWVPGALTRSISAARLYRSRLNDSKPVIRTMRTVLLSAAEEEAPLGREEAAAVAAAVDASSALILWGGVRGGAT